MEEHTYVVRFPDVTDAEAGRLADDLRAQLLDADPKLVAARRRQDPSTQDFGTTLVLILGAPSIVILANAIKDWVTRNKAKVWIEDETGTLVATDLASSDVFRITEAFRSHNRRKGEADKP